MDNFEILGSVALRLHQEMSRLYFIALPVFFLTSIAITWFRGPAAWPGFSETVQRAVVATLLLVGFQEMSGIILTLAKSLGDHISDMSGIDSIIRMAGEKANSYKSSDHAFLLGLNDMIIATLSFASYLLLYAARYVSMAVYHFSWVFLTILAPILLLFHVFTSRITQNLSLALCEIASWRICWAVLSAILSALPFGEAYRADGGYVTVAVMNFVVAVAMAATPYIVHSLVGPGFAAAASMLHTASLAAVVAAPVKASGAISASRARLSQEWQRWGPPPARNSVNLPSQGSRSRQTVGRNKS